MKRTLSTLTALLTSAMTLTGLAIASHAQTKPDFAQDLLTGIFNRSCTRATEVSYRSNRIATNSTNGTQIHVDAILRKIVDPNSPLRNSDTNTRCLPDARQTSSHELVIQRPNEIRRIQLTPHNDGYLIYHLQSFSPDGQHLIADLQTIYASGDSDSFVTIFDMTGPTLAIRTPAICQELDVASFYGFISSTEAAVLCEGYQGASQDYVAVNIQTGATRRLTGVPEATNYGLQVNEPAVTKIQNFE